MTVLGAVALPQLPPEQLRDLARVADASGLEQLWLWEDCFWTSGVASAATVLASTERVEVGVGLLPVPLRNVAVTAMELATLYRLFGERVQIGVGHGIQDWMAQVGARVDSPLTLLAEHLAALRTLLAGEQLTVNGRYVQLDAVALDWPPRAAPTLYAGATGPRSLRLVGEHAGGVILTASTSPDGVREARQLVDQGRAAAGRTDPYRVVVYLQVATGPGAAERLAAEQRREAGGPVPDTGVAGDAYVVAEAVRRYAAAGADTVVLQPTVDDPDPAGFVRFAAEQVRPLVS